MYTEHLLLRPAQNQILNLKRMFSMRVLTFILLCTLTSISHASQAEALNRLSAILKDPELTQKAYNAGEERISLCGYCHGRDGNSTRPHIPNLAEQTPVYLFNTFEKFANGEREDFVMSKAASILTMEDRVNIALYYGAQKVTEKQSANPELDEHGKTKFNQICTACHGANGQGQDDMPRLAGQPADYVRDTLKRFRAGGKHRPGSLMIPIAKQLSDNDIEALASYVQGLNP